MRPRAWLTFSLAAIIGALPTLLSLCDLRCVTHAGAATTARSATPPSTCAGHRDGKGEAPAGSQSDHDCGAHALLAKGGGAAPTFHLARAWASPAVLGGGLDLDREARAKFEALSLYTDLSPPLGRSSTVLRI